MTEATCAFCMLASTMGVLSTISGQKIVPLTGPKNRSVDASAGQPVASSDVDKTAILSTFAGVLSTFQAPPNHPLPRK